MDKEKWIDEVMKSLQHKQQAETPGSLQQRVQDKIAARDKPAAKIITIKWVAVAAAAACVLLLLNIFTISQWQRQKQGSSVSSTVVYNESLMPDFSSTNN